MTRLPEGSGPKLVSTPVEVTASVTIAEGGAEGVIFAIGGEAAGWSLFLWEGKPRFHYNYFGMRRHDAVGPGVVTPGDHTITLTIAPQAPTPGAPADAVLAVDGAEVARVHIDEQVPQRCGTECLDVGQDSVSPVCADYGSRGTFPFTGTIGSVTLRLGPDATTGMERLKLATSMD